VDLIFEAIDVGLEERTEDFLLGGQKECECECEYLEDNTHLSLTLFSCSYSKIPLLRSTRELVVISDL
jgi:hypothetical protein